MRRKVLTIMIAALCFSLMPSVAGCIPSQTSKMLISIADDVLIAIGIMDNAFESFCNYDKLSVLCDASKSAEYQKIKGSLLSALRAYNDGVVAGTIGATKDEVAQAYASLESFLETLGVIKSVDSVEASQSSLRSYSAAATGNGMGKVFKPVYVARPRF